MLRALLAKDLRRARRNPLPWLLNLALPILITAVIGMVFGSGSGNDNSLGRIKFAVVAADAVLVVRSDAKHGAFSTRRGDGRTSRPEVRNRGPSSTVARRPNVIISFKD